MMPKIVSHRSRRPRRYVGVSLSAIVVACCGSSTHAVEKSWNTGNGSWSNAGNWTPAGAPGPADIARIGNLAGAYDDTVFGDQDVTVAGIVITDEMALQTQGHVFAVLGDTILNGDHTRLNIYDAGPGVDFLTHDLLVSGDHARVFLEDATVRVGGLFSLGPGTEFHRLYPSDGLINFVGVGGTTFSNDGLVTAGPGHISLVQSFAGLYDLDGTTGNGEIRVSGDSAASMAINGQGLADSFSGTISLGPDATLQMNLTDGWEADASSTIEAFNYSNGALARLGGDAVRLRGSIDVSTTAELRVAADATLAPTANATIDDNATLDFDLLASAVIEGGDYTVGQGGLLRFRGATTVEGGTFDTPTSEFSDGSIQFNGPTNWRGDVTILGAARQGANASVTAPSTITAERFDLGGDRWDVNAPMVINTVSLGWAPGASFVGELNIEGPIFAKLTVNLAGGTQTAWSLSSGSRLNLTGHSALFINRLAGSPVINFGETNVSDSKVDISSTMILMPNSVVNFAAATSELRMRGETYIREGATFNGAGTLHNGTGGQMWLFDGTTLGDVGLVNLGELRFRRYGYPDHAAFSAVDRFTNDDEGTIQFRLAGYNLGDEFDHLSVTSGPATLDGLIDVLLTDDGDGQFLPEIGDEFTVLSAFGGVSGQFLNDPISHAAGQQFHWTVLYHPFDVTLRLDSITAPEPGSLSAALMATAALLWRKRSQRFVRVARQSC